MSLAFMAVLVDATPACGDSGGCSDASQCADGQICRSGSCEACEFDSQCAEIQSGGTCEEGKCEFPATGTDTDPASGSSSGSGSETSTSSASTTMTAGPTTAPVTTAPMTETSSAVTTDADCTLREVQLFEADPSAPDTGVVTCSEGNLETEDGMVAGLGRFSEIAGSEATFDEQTVSACIRIDYGEEAPASQIRVIARRAATVCVGGAQCTFDPDPLEGCGTGNFYNVFVSSSFDDHTWVGEGSVLDAFSMEVFPVDREARFVTICRTGATPERDQIEVDLLQLCE